MGFIMQQVTSAPNGDGDYYCSVELRGSSFVISCDNGEQRIELPKAALAPLAARLTEAVMLEHGDDTASG